MKSTKTLKPPQQLKKTGRAFWRLVQTTFDIADHQQSLVTVAAELLDRADECRTVIDAEGLVTFDRFDQRKAHPLLAPERDARAAFLLACQRLGIDVKAPAPTAEARKW